MDESTKRMVEHVAEQAAQRAAEKAVADTLKTLGVDVADPFETQKDMAYIRDLRNSSARISNKALLTVVGTVVTAAIGMLILGVQGWFKSGGGTP